MNIKFVTFICLLFFLYSCKSLQPAAYHNHSNNSNTSFQKNNPHFLDNVSITPGEKKSNLDYYKKTEQSNNYKDAAPSSFNIEKADWLQFKYAIIMDMPVEQLDDLALLQQVDHWWGTRYCMGGDDESCIDCSAFTQIMLNSVYGVKVPRTAREQYDFSTRIQSTDLKEGDLVFFESGRNIIHVGLYIANNKFVHASTSSGVTISDLSDDYWSKKYAGAGRVQTSLTSSKTSR